jgi:muconolactone delta-isomerase
MKYLVTVLSQTASLPPEQGAKLVAAAKEWIQAGLDAGRVDCAYLFADNMLGIAIHNADSHEELFERLLSYPLYRYFDFEVRPLCDWKRAMAAIEAAFWSR